MAYTKDEFKQLVDDIQSQSWYKNPIGFGIAKVDRGQINKDIEVVGFGQSPIFKMANKYRYEILVRSSNIKALLSALHSISSPNVSIDMDTIY